MKIATIIRFFQAISTALQPFNPTAPPFEPPARLSNNFPVITVGPSQVQVNGKIWEAIANNRVLPAIPHSSFSPQPHTPVKLTLAQPLQPSPVFYNQNNIFAGYVKAKNQKIVESFSNVFFFILPEPPAAFRRGLLT